ncbi:hypothetical protein B0H19DRAFT_1066576 [Mycena capillaripes]|nr:hypothetical protein B0H19DRAFT_1066576 [Mycena capillaripes]
MKGEQRKLAACEGGHAKQRKKRHRNQLRQRDELFSAVFTRLLGLVAEYIRLRSGWQCFVRIDGATTAALAMLAGGKFPEAGEWRRLEDGGIAGVEMSSTSVNGSGSRGDGYSWSFSLSGSGSGWGGCRCPRCYPHCGLHGALPSPSPVTKRIQATQSVQALREGKKTYGALDAPRRVGVGRERVTTDHLSRHVSRGHLPDEWCTSAEQRAREAGAAALLMGMIAARGKRRLATSPPIFDGSDRPLMEGARPAHRCRRIAIIIANYR